MVIIGNNWWPRLSKELEMETQKVITTLNELLQTCHDGTKGFRACAKDVKSTKLVPVFEAGARRCEGGATELAAEIRKLGGEPASGGSVSGALYRVWTDLVSTLSGHSEKAVLEQCERAEDEAKKIYEKAIALDLPPAIKSLVTQQFAGLKENHDRIRKLRDELSA
jgi:uncharacterized protein (TIGR02284 family)